jgi:hypothetical protein
MSNKYRPFIMTDNNLNLSVAWAKAFITSIEPTMSHLSPLLIRVNDFSNNIIQEDSVIRDSIDEHLGNLSEQSCHTVANTIFPISLWNAKSKRNVLFERYSRIIPQIQKSCSANRFGLYFQRMISYNNQLEHIISTYVDKKIHRSSALQISIFDPLVDHRGTPFLGFPCLQHVFFTPMDNKTLAVTGIYAKQYLFKKAYGNYLGLCRLGQFVAHELGMMLTQMNCYVADAEMEISKALANNLKDTIKRRLFELGHSI